MAILSHLDPFAYRINVCDITFRTRYIYAVRFDAIYSSVSVIFQNLEHCNLWYYLSLLVTVTVMYERVVSRICVPEMFCAVLLLRCITPVSISGGNTQSQRSETKPQITVENFTFSQKSVALNEYC